MTKRSWIRKLFTRPTRTFRKAPRRTRLNLEQLEDRVMPSTLGSYAFLEGPSAGSDADIVATSGAWTATSNATWLHTSASGTGNGLASLSFDANSGATRTGTLTIAGLTLSVTQAGSTYVAANPVTTLVSSGLNSPAGVAVDGAGNVYIADTGNSAIEEWNATTQQLTTLVSSGLASPQNVAVDGAGNVYIADSGNNAIKEWNATTQQVTTLVSSGLNRPTGVAVDGAGNVYIADYGHSALKEWNATTQQVTTLVSSGLFIPYGVAVDGAGNVYIADYGHNAIKEWNATTQQLTTLVSSGLNTPTDVAVDGAGNVYIADFRNNAIKEWNATTQQVTTLVSPGQLGYGAGIGPGGVAVDAAGNVYIADYGHNALKELVKAYVPGSPVSEPGGVGSDALAAVLPTTQALTGVFAPSSDQSWLTIGTTANGVVNFSFTANTGTVPRTAHITLLGQQITVTQDGSPQFAVTASTPETAGTAFDITVTAEDALGNVTPGYTGTVTFTTSDMGTGVALPSNYTFMAADNGVHTFSALLSDGVTLVTAGSQTVSVTDTVTSITGTSGTITVNPAAASQIVITTQPPRSVTAGIAFGLVAKVEDRFANVETGDNSSQISLVLSTGSFARGSTTLLTVVNGVADFTAEGGGLLVIDTAASYTITASAGTLTSTTSSSFNVVAAAVSQLEITGLPSSSTAGALQPVAVEAVDSFGNIGSGYGGTITFSCTDGLATATFPGTNPPPATALQGFIYTFNAADPAVVTLAVALNTNGLQTITAITNDVPSIQLQISTTVSGATVVPPTAQASQVVPPTGTSAPVTSGNLSAVVSGGNTAQTTLAVAATYNGNPTGTTVVVNGQMLAALAFNDFRVVNPTWATTVTLTLTVPGGVANAQAVYIIDGRWVVAAPQERINSTTIVVTLSASSTPTIFELNGTVFTIAVPVAASSSNTTVGVFPPLASTETLPAVQASFVSSSSLSLTLSPLQQSTISTSQSSNTGGGDGDGSSDADVQKLWDYFSDFWRWMLGTEQPPAGKDIDLAIGLGTGAKATGTDGDTAPKTPGNGAAGAGSKAPATETPEPQLRRNDEARDAFFASALSTTELPNLFPRTFPAPSSSVIEWSPVTTEGERCGSLALLGLPGLGLMLEEIHWQHAPRRRGSHPEPAEAF